MKTPTSLRGVAVSLAAMAIGAGLSTAVADVTEEEAAKIAAAEMAKPRTEPGYTAPRLSIGQPDLQGVWSNASNTRLTRSSEFDKLTLTDEEFVAAVEVHPQNVRQRTDDGQKLGDGLLDGSDLARGRGYNAFWIDPGTAYASVKGTWRTSWIVDPPNGQIPYSENGRRLQREAAELRRRGSGFDNPEERSLGERCIIQPTPGPPIGQYLYNNNVRINQAPDHIVITTEMINDARIVRLTDEHRDPELRPYMGDSIGWWEGDTLVVETRDMNPMQRQTYGVYLTENGKIIERFTRYNDSQILYEFEIHDPDVYSQVWKAEMALTDIGEDMYEYACHEGNDGLIGILEGGRYANRQGREMVEEGERSE